MEDLALHVLDLVENATGAGASLVEIHVDEDRERNLLRIRIRDNGRGMSRELLEKVRDPFVTTRTTRRVGLGIPMMEQAAREADGELHIRSGPGEGTEVTATFRADHIDRKPVGDMGATIVTIIAGNPELDIVYTSNAGGRRRELDTRDVRAQLEGGVPLNHPAVLGLIRDLLGTG